MLRCMHYYTVPGFSWDSMLIKYTIIALLHDVVIVMFIKKGISAVVSDIVVTDTLKVNK